MDGRPPAGCIGDKIQGPKARRDVAGRQGGLPMDAVSQDAASGGIEDAPALAVVHVHDGALGRIRAELAEEGGLDVQILSPRPVQVHVVGRDIREHGDIEVAPGDPVQRKGVRGDLHHHMRDPGANRLVEEALNLEGFRGGQGGPFFPLSHALDHRADQPRPDTGLA